MVGLADPDQLATGLDIAGAWSFTTPRPEPSPEALQDDAAPSPSRRVAVQRRHQVQSAGAGIWGASRVFHGRQQRVRRAAYRRSRSRAVLCCDAGTGHGDWSGDYDGAAAFSRTDLRSPEDHRTKAGERRF